MTSIDELYKSDTDATANMRSLQVINADLNAEAQSIMNKMKDVQYRYKVAEVQKDDEQILNQLNAEMTVLNQMAQDLTTELNSNAESIDKLKSVFEARENQLKMYRFFAFLAMGLCYFMPSFGMGFLYIIVCFFVAYYLSSQANDQLAYSEGYTVQEWKSKKETISASNKQKAQDREALAKSIAEHLKK